MADQVVMGPQREAGLSYVDSLYWGKGDNVFFAEDSNAPGGYNIAGIYNRAARGSAVNGVSSHLVAVNRQGAARGSAVILPLQRGGEVLGLGHAGPRSGRSLYSS